MYTPCAYNNNYWSHDLSLYIVPRNKQKWVHSPGWLARLCDLNQGRKGKILKPYHRCMVSKPRVHNSLSDHIITNSSCYEAVQQCWMTNRCPTVYVVNKFSVGVWSPYMCSKLKIRVSCDSIRRFTSPFTMNIVLIKLAFQNIMRAGNFLHRCLSSHLD